MNKNVFVAIAFLAMVILTLSCETLAEETEELQTDEMSTEEKDVTFMFVQTAQSGTLVPVDGEDNLYTLTLMGVSSQTIAFSDRPERVVVQAPMQQFLDGFSFGPNNPPNAAIEILEADDEEDVAVVELFDPVYDDANQTLRYTVSILETPNLSYAVFNERADRSLPETFGPSALFIDDCPDGTVDCYKGPYSWSDYCGEVDNVGCCWEWSSLACECCGDGGEKCVKKFGAGCPDDHGTCCGIW
jgi:hypothetical protein